MSRQPLRSWLARGALASLLVVLAAAGPAPDSQIRQEQWHLEFLHIERAHRYSQGDGVVVAVVDTGVDASHPDLARSLVPGTDLTITEGLDLGHDPRGYSDINGHGTGMAGIIAAHGISLGIAPKAKVQPVRTFTIGDGLDGVDIDEGAMWAATHGARVISMSVGTTESPQLERAMETAQRNDIVVVAAAGNYPNDQSVIYPAAIPSVLAVAAVDKNGEHADFSVTGPEVDIAAPGTDITSPGLKHGYSRHTYGTSDATAIVAGAVALIRAKYPDLTAPEVIKLITSTADDKGPPGRDDQYGYGVLNIVKALTTTPPTHSPVAGDDGSPARPWVVGAAIAILAVVAVAGVSVIARRR